MKKEVIMIQLNPRFQKEIFQKLVSRYGSSFNAGKIIRIPAASI